MNETKLQSDAFKYLWNKYPELRGRVFAINNNSENRIKGAMNKAMGVIAGVSDMAMLIQNSVIWIEWKIEKGKQSSEQKKFEILVNSLGMKYFIVRNQDEFIKLILQHK